jgi:Rrf2 family protein
LAERVAGSAVKAVEFICDLFSRISIEWLVAVGMLKLTKKADYGLIAMRHLARHSDLGACSAKDMAEMYSIPQEALAKILQRLTREGLLVSQYGTNGGYILARDPRQISAFEVIRAIEGPLFITACSVDNDCEQSDHCTIRGPLRKVSRSIEDVLKKLTIWEMTEPESDASPELVTLGSMRDKAVQV